MWVAIDVYNRIFFGGKQKSLGGARYATTPISAYREYAKNSKSPILCSNIMIDVDLYVFDDEKSNKNGFKSIKPSYIPLLPHKCHFSCHVRPVNRKKWNIWYNTMIDGDLYVFDDEKSNKNGFKLIKQSYIPLLPHKCHFFMPRKTHG